jgi:ankyrin repeat protein
MIGQTEAWQILWKISALLIIAYAAFVYWQRLHCEHELTSKTPPSPIPSKQIIIRPQASITLNNEAHHKKISENIVNVPTSSSVPDVKAKNNQIFKGHWTDLHTAAREGQFNVAALLIADGADVNAKTDGSLQTPLYWAIRSGHSAMIELLISNGADVNAINPHGITLLHTAIFFGRVDFVRTLLGHNAKLNVKTISGDYPGETPLHMAAFTGNEDIVKLLLSYGVDINATDKSGNTPLRRCVDKGHQKLVELLIAKGADIAKSDIYGVTPLHIAVRNADIQIAKLLIAKGSDVNAIDKFGLTPFDYVSRDNTKIAELLKQYGAICALCGEF